MTTYLFSLLIRGGAPVYHLLVIAIHKLAHHALWMVVARVVALCRFMWDQILFDSLKVKKLWHHAPK